VEGEREQRRRGTKSSSLLYSLFRVMLILPFQCAIVQLFSCSVVAQCCLPCCVEGSPRSVLQMAEFASVMVLGYMEERIAQGDLTYSSTFIGGEPVCVCVAVQALVGRGVVNFQRCVYCML
jgi:hypothetical protein